jgi:hypothetical protein
MLLDGDSALQQEWTEQVRARWAARRAQAAEAGASDGAWAALEQAVIGTAVDLVSGPGGRDRHCQWAGGCTQPAGACQVHHTRHKARGGTTSAKDCVLLCPFHHQVVIHRWGWTLVVNPDGTTTAWNKNKTKVLHSHGPPARTG